MKNKFRKTTISTLKQKIAKLEKRENTLQDRIEKTKADKKRGYILVPISKDSTTNKKVNFSSLDKKSMRLEIIDAETELLEVQEDLKDNNHILDVELGIAKDSYISTKKAARDKVKEKKAKLAEELLDLANKNGSKKDLIKISAKIDNENFTPPLFMNELRPILNKYKTPHQRPIKSVPKSIAKKLMAEVKKIK